MTEALPTIIFHSETLWFDTSHERIEQLDADPVAAETEVWPTGPGYDVEPDLGAFIEAARSAVPVLLDSIDRVLALHVALNSKDFWTACSECSDPTNGMFVPWPCATYKAIEVGS